MKSTLSWMKALVLLAVVVCVFGGTVFGQPWDGNGTEGDPYQIWDANQMYALGYNPKHWDKNFVLMDDIDIGKFTGKSFKIIGNYYVPYGLAIDFSEEKLYWTTDYEMIQRSNLDGTGIEDYLSTDVIHPRGIAIDDSNRKIYWTDVWTGKIKRANLDGTNVEDIVVASRSYPYGIALDISAGKVYWTDLNFGTIRRANIDGSSIETIIRKPSSGYPRSVSLDLARGKIYWTNGRADRIQRANLDGTDIEDVVTVNNPLWISLDTGEGKMYWTKTGPSKIQRANLDGTDVEDLVMEDAGYPYWLALDTTKKKVYWTNIKTEKVRRANFDGSEIEDLISSKFAGVFDGNGHKIRNFTYEDSDRDGAGIFGRAGDTAEIRNVHLEDVNVAGDYCVGALVGLSEGVVSNCSSTGVVWGCENVSGLVGMAEETSIIVHSTTDVLINVCDDWGFAAGGLVGHNFMGIVSNCSAAGSIKQGIDTYFAGGLIGFNEGSTTNCFATGDVSGYGMIGGLIGENGGWGHIENCYATGNVLGSHGAGGLIGRNFVPVLNCYAMGNVTEGEDAYYGMIGGLIGWDCDSAVNCYSTGSVSGTGIVGAFVGYYDDGGVYNSCFWNTDINPDVNGIGNITDPNVIGLPTGEMQDANTFIDAGWDFNTPIWKMCDGPDYPKLGWEECPEAATLLDVVSTMLDPNSLKNSNMKNALINKINAVLQMIDEGLNEEALTKMASGGSVKANRSYNGALSKLENDILAKMDGCAETGEPDKNDWIITCEGQNQVYPLIMETIEYVRSLME